MCEASKARPTCFICFMLVPLHNHALELFDSASYEACQEHSRYVVDPADLQRASCFLVACQYDDMMVLLAQPNASWASSAKHSWHS